MKCNIFTIRCVRRTNIIICVRKKVIKTSLCSGLFNSCHNLGCPKQHPRKQCLINRDRHQHATSKGMDSQR